MDCNLEKIPKHVAIIMDGNGRWARRKGLPRLEGHRNGAGAVKEAIQSALELGIEILSLYTFSTENWQRSKGEIDNLMRLLKQYLSSHLPELKKNGIRLAISGDKMALPSALQVQIDEVISQTKDNSRLILNLALNYGGRQDILQAARKIAHKVKDNALKIDEIDEKIFSGHLYTGELPDPDLLIRTAGEERVSNFFLWQISYCELYFTSKLWPDFKKQDLIDAVLEYQKRERKFGA
ncbi:MAG: isoprenyl transferase [Candidatus Omnitrophota bacterium]|nr:MAG: isoprenyl transferase [Candidatus Omnitrophota bacterium]